MEDPEDPASFVVLDTATGNVVRHDTANITAALTWRDAPGRSSTTPSSSLSTPTPPLDGRRLPRSNAGCPQLTFSVSPASTRPPSMP